MTATTTAGPGQGIRFDEVSSALSTLRILCVDDNRDAADTLGDLLGLFGADVMVCHGGPEAVAEAGDFQPDVALLDVNMPQIDGCELASFLRESAGERPMLVAALTAMDGYNALSREADAGFDLHFTKPVNPSELLEALVEFACQRERDAA